MPPIDARMVSWDEEPKSKIDTRMVKWDAAPEPQKGAEPYSFDNPLIPSLMSMAQGPTLGWGDELAGMLPGVDRERYRATVNQHEAEYPGASLAGKLGAGAVVPFGLAAKTMSPLMAGLTTGSIATAAQMAGDAPEGNRVNEAAKGALLGPLGAGAMMLGMKPVGAIADGLVAQASKLPLFGGRVADYLAARRVAEAFGRDGVDGTEVSRRMAELGPEGRLADAGDTNVYQSLDLNATMPGETSALLHGRNGVIPARQKGSTERMREMVDITNDGMGRANDVLTSLIQQKQTAATPLYEKLNQLTIKPTGALTSQVQAALELKAGERARDLATANRDNFSLGDPTQPMSMRDLNHLKMGLDDMVAKNTDPDGKMNNLGRSLSNLRADMIKQLDFLTKNQYKAARDAFAGPAALEDAINSGMRFMNQDAVKLERALSSMSNSERDAFKIGAAEALRLKLGTRGGQTEAIGATTGKNDNLLEKLKLMYGNDVTYEKAIKILEREGTLRKIEGAGKGSATASRLLSAEDQASKVAEDAGSAIAAATGAGGPWAGFKALMSGKAVKDSAFGTPEPVRNAIGQMMLGRPTDEQIMLMDQLRKNIAQRNAGAAGIYGQSVSQLPGLLTQ